MGYVAIARLAFIIRSGLNDPRPAIPTPAFDVPNAAPIAVTRNRMTSCRRREFPEDSLLITI
jgi:hypothetical protein